MQLHDSLEKTAAVVDDNFYDNLVAKFFPEKKFLNSDLPQTHIYLFIFLHRCVNERLS